MRVPAISRIAIRTSAILALLPAFAADGARAQETYFPLEVGTAWTYREARFGMTRELEVTARDGRIAILEGRGFPDLKLRDGGEEIDIELGDEGFVLFYRFVPGSFEHRDPFECDDERRVDVSRSDPIETPAGRIEDVLRLDFADNVCSDAGTVTEWWAQEVGLVRWEELNIAGLLAFELVEFTMGSPPLPFVRGDANADGRTNITDAIAILSPLFLGGVEVPCLDAADVNDDGKRNVTDAVALLQHLFLGEPPPPPPTGECGVDPTRGDALDCASYPACDGRQAAVSDDHPAQ